MPPHGVLAPVQPDMYSMYYPPQAMYGAAAPPPPGFHLKPPIPPSRSGWGPEEGAKFRNVHDPHIRQTVQSTYQRLRDRRRKLQALRRGIDLDDMDYSDAMSMQSEATDYGDRKSMISTNSYTHGESCAKSGFPLLHAALKKYCLLYTVEKLSFSFISKLI